MITLSFEPVSLPGPRAELGECPQWLPERRALQHVDIPGRTILRRPLGGGPVPTLRTPDDVGFALALDDDGVLAGAGRDLLLFPSFAAAPISLADVRHEPDVNRFNDARCDPAGRVFAGTM
jgi:sugar lactone lactonase YvrE